MIQRNKDLLRGLFIAFAWLFAALVVSVGVVVVADKLNDCSASHPLGR